MSTKQKIMKEFNESCRRFLKEAWALHLQYCNTVCSRREGCPVIESLKKDSEVVLMKSMPDIQRSLLLIVDHLVYECTGEFIGQRVFLMQAIMRNALLGVEG